MLKPRLWTPKQSEALARAVAAELSEAGPADIARKVEELVAQNEAIHGFECINLNPAGNVMNPRAEALLARGLGSRPSLGYPAEKHEAGLEAIEKIEAIVAELAARVFRAGFVEIRLPTGCAANLCCFMATLSPGDVIIAPPPAIGGHASHQANGAAGLYGLRVVPAPVDAERYTIDVSALQTLCHLVRPKLITVGGSLNLHPHPVADIRAVADEVGALVLYDAAHVAGLIGGGTWQQPLAEGAHLMTLSTYKSLGGPPGSLILTNEPELAEMIDRVAFPGLTANPDPARAAALAIALTDICAHGRAYASAMLSTARALAEGLATRGIAIFGKARGFTASHQFAVETDGYDGGPALARRLRRANLLTSSIDLPFSGAEGVASGLRLGTPELVRIGVRVAEMDELADIIATAIWDRVETSIVAARATAFRRSFSGVHYVC